MKTVGVTLCAIAIALAAFGTWGAFTAAGRRRFDEMAGIIPMGALLVGGLLALAGVVVLLLGFRRP